MLVEVLVQSLAAPLSTAAGMRDCVERGGVWLESGRCELPNDDAAARCHRQGGRWLSSKGQSEMAPVDLDAEKVQMSPIAGSTDGGNASETKKARSIACAAEPFYEARFNEVEVLRMRR